MEDSRETHQRELPLPFPELSGDLPLLAARMVNEYEYYPRLAYLEWVQGEWAESTDTVEGRHTHRRVDRASGKLPLCTASECSSSAYSLTSAEVSR